MAYSIEIKDLALNLRKQGFSLNEISGKFKIPRSVVSDWSRAIILNKNAKKRLASKIKRGQLISAENKKARTIKMIESCFREAVGEIEKMQLNKDSIKILCAIIYWCEGVKSLYSGIGFTNSDPQLVRTFLKLFRESFKLDEKKFRVCLHLHEYHNADKQIKFWSGITRINRNQFIKPFRKNNTGKIVRNGYNGCVSIRYYDTAMARRLIMTARAFFEKFNKIKGV